MRRLFTVDEYQRMAEAGILDEDDRVELLDGQIVEMSPIGALHAGTVNRLARLLISALGPRAVVGVQNPVVLDDFTEPQPDLFVARPRPDDYMRGHPRPPDLHLVVEVAESSAEWDRREKLPRYARAGVPEAWLVDLEGRAAEIHRQPSPDGYADVRRATGPIAPLAFPDLRIDVGDIGIPPRT